MTSLKKIIANRANAQKSPGPQGPEGKRASAKNSTKHGLFSKHLQIREEDKPAFLQFEQQINAEFEPQGPSETFYVEHLIDQFWRLRHCLKIDTDVFEFYRVYKDRKGDVSTAFAHDASQVNCLTRLSRYASFFERGLLKDLAELRKLQERRPRPSAQSQQPGVLADSAIGQSQHPAHHSGTLNPSVATTQPQPPAPSIPTSRLPYFAPVGILSKQALLSDEDPAQFEDYVQSLFAEWQPRRATKAWFVELFALTSWRLVRLSRVEAGLFDQYRFYEKVDGGPLTAFVQDAAGLDCFSKLTVYETRLRNSLSKILKELLT